MLQYSYFGIGHELACTFILMSVYQSLHKIHVFHSALKQTLEKPRFSQTKCFPHLSKFFLYFNFRLNVPVTDPRIRRPVAQTVIEASHVVKNVLPS